MEVTKMTTTETAPTEKMVFIGLHGPDDPEIAILPFMLGVAALAMEVQVTILLQGPSVLLAHKGIAEHVFSGCEGTSLKKLMDQFFELGGKLYICTPCVESRKISKQVLVQGAQLVKAGKVVSDLLEAKTTLTF
jgi:uncharacterized protein involved in oxidation of intracellular sulfur